jgi:hypothetical protein
MAGRFTVRRVVAPEVVPAEEPTSALEAVPWTVFPEPTAEPVLTAGNPNPLAHRQAA